MILSEEVIRALTPAKYWGKWDIDFEDAISLFQIKGFFNDEEKQFILLRSQGYSMTDLRVRMNRAPRTLYHHQKNVFYKYHYAKHIISLLEQGDFGGGKDGVEKHKEVNCRRR